MPGLGTSFGRGRATTPQWDLANADCIVIQGSDMAECHPVAYRFVMQAKSKGATIVHIDPRFTRTSAMSDVHAPVRPGTDIAFVGGLIRYVLEHERYMRDYVVHYTNAPCILREDFVDAEDLDGIFSGLDRERRRYDAASWAYATEAAPSGRSPIGAGAGESFTEQAGPPIGTRPPLDPTLEHPRCVFQVLKRHFARYTPEMVERVTGCPHDVFLRIAEAITSNSGRERTTAWCYAVGWTQHTTGVQMIRSAAILQLLLGNVGRPGGGIVALRGHATIQGSTDIPTLYNLLPGYLPMPSALSDHASLHDYLAREGSPTGWWVHMPAYLVSLLKAWYGDAAQPDNDFAFAHLPQITGDHSQLPMTMAIHDGQIHGLFVLGQNPAVGGHNTRFVRRGLASLDWMVVRDLYETETAAFWYASPEVERGELETRRIKTEVFFIPAASPIEKDGSFTNTHALVQYHGKVVDPPADARSETWFLHWLGRRLKELYAGDDRPQARAIHDLTWNYPVHGPHGEPVLAAIVKEINGYTVADGRPVPGFAVLRDDGSTACGCWIYSGIMPEEGLNRAASRLVDPPGVHGVHAGWGFSWPANRRLLYNRASADPQGEPWSERKRFLWWDGSRGRWAGPDVPDFEVTKPPGYTPPPGARGMAAHSGSEPFIMKTDGRGALFVGLGVKDGPLPTHYEPVESPVRNPLYPEQHNPVAELFRRRENPLHAPADPRYPYVITTYRLTEQHTGGQMSRSLPWLAELQPGAFVELDPELAAAKGVVSGDWVTVTTARGSVEVRALVTERLQPLTIDGRRIHQVGLPWHFGYRGVAQGAVANDLTALVGDPTTTIHEGKAFTCDLQRREIGPVGER